MIEISEHDLPITVAEKLINATYDIPKDKGLERALNIACGGNGTRDVFSDEELLEIAEHLFLYCSHGENKEKEKENENEEKQK